MDKIERIKHLLEEGKKLLEEKKLDLAKEKFTEANSVKTEMETEAKEKESQLEAKKIDDYLGTINRTIPVMAQTEDKVEEKSIEKKAFESFVRKGLRNMEKKELSSVRDADGGVLVPEELGAQIVKKMDDILQIRKLATVIRTSKSSIAFPTYDYTPTINNTAENAAASDTDVSNAFGKTNFTPFKKTLLFKVPLELMEDSEFDVVDHLLERFAYEMAKVLETDFISGSGINHSLGLLNANLTAADLTSSATVINAKSVLEAPGQLKLQYRLPNRSPAYILPRRSVRELDKLTDSQGRPLFRENLSMIPGQPAKLNGFNLVEVENFVDPSADGDCAFIFGDLKHFWIVERRDLTVQRLDELYAANGQVGFILTVRVDAAPVIQEAFIRYNRN